MWAVSGAFAATCFACPIVVATAIERAVGSVFATSCFASSVAVTQTVLRTVVGVFATSCFALSVVVATAIIRTKCRSFAADYFADPIAVTDLRLAIGRAVEWAVRVGFEDGLTVSIAARAAVASTATGVFRIAANWRNAAEPVAARLFVRGGFFKIVWEWCSTAIEMAPASLFILPICILCEHRLRCHAEGGTYHRCSKEVSKRDLHTLTALN